MCLIWGTTYVAIRIAIETFPPLVMTSVRWIVAGALLGLILKLRGGALPPRSAWKSLALLGVLLIGVGNGAVVWAETVVPSGLTAVLVAVTPFWMLGISQFLPGAERMTRRHIIGLIVGFSGVVFLVWPEVKTGNGALFLAGVAATQLACVGWAAGSNYARHRTTGGTVLGASALQMIFGGLFLLGVGLIRGEAAMVSVRTVSARSIEAVLYLVFVGSMVGFSAYAYALHHLPLSLVSLYAYINPMIAVALGTLILSEPLTPRLVIASAVVLCGIVVVKSQRESAG